MKRKTGFVEEKVGNYFYLYPVGENVDGTIFSMNDTCKFIWDLLEKDLIESQIIEVVAKYYGVETDVVSEDIKEILSQMSIAGVIDMYN